MKILFTGDSITQGNTGTSFVKKIVQAYPHVSFTNLGKNGDTMSGIFDRTIRHLSEGNVYDLLILQGGYNDILLPAFWEKGFLFRMVYKSQLKKGITPAVSAGDFYTTLSNGIYQIRKLHQGRMVLLTLGCINEYSHAATNILRKKFNTIARHIALEKQVMLCDTGKMADRYLSLTATRDYCLENFWYTAFIDRLTSRFRQGPAWVSRKRKLNITIDGVHLNATGAWLFYESVTGLLDTIVHQPDKITAIQ